ncbi:hypothetical protein Asi02nite_62700 [Asanoa siamensis]|uniref:Uncharacterized protein n=1 Tax=Asanoa siamensis TaxID=926357 RepID=A0ABQ4CZP4_9ACTN|nr:hypothetical protein Asi02nite_62700 [Asanoa siamensis]
MWWAVFADFPDAFGAVGDAAIALAGLCVRHQIGGYPMTCQGDVVSQVVGAVLGERLAPESPLWQLEARRWVLLLQVDFDAAVATWEAGARPTLGRHHSLSVKVK